jgi:hypothetical protein
MAEGTTAHADFASPYREVRTVIYDLERKENLAWLACPIWPPDGAVIELSLPNKDAVVLGVRLVLPPGDVAIVRVDVSVPEKEESLPRHFAERLSAGASPPERGGTGV